MKRTRLLLFAAMLAVALASIPADADIIQVGTVNVSSVSQHDEHGISWSTSVTLTNLTSTTMAFDLLTVYFPGGTPDPVPTGPLLIAPGDTAVSMIDFSYVLKQYTLSGSLATADFTTAAGSFRASALRWTSPMFAIDFNGSLPVTIEAVPSAAVPEPSSLMLLGISGLTCVAGLARRSLRK